MFETKRKLYEHALEFKKLPKSLGELIQLKQIKRNQNDKIHLNKEKGKFHLKQKKEMEKRNELDEVQKSVEYYKVGKLSKKETF
jgi:hypothetical protein